MKRYFEAIKLCFAYYKQPLCLKDISFTLSKGGKLLVIGKEEVGKTTLLKALSGFDSTYFGEVRFEDKNIKHISDKDKNFSLLLSEPVLISGTIQKNFEFLCEALGIENLSEGELKELLLKFKIERTGKDKIKDLSLLEKRKLALARTYFKKPNMIFLDDQFLELSKEENMQMQEALEIILSTNITTIVATGSLGYVANRKFYEKLNYESVIYLNLLKSYNYKLIRELFDKKIDYNVFEFMDNYQIIQGKITRKEGTYFFEHGENYLIKFDRMFYDKLSLLSLTDFEEENVYLCIDKEIIFEEVSDREFNKYLKIGEFFIYLELDSSRVI